MKSLIKNINKIVPATLVALAAHSPLAGAPILVVDLDYRDGRR